MRVTLACLLLGAGVIHFAMVPAHAGESMVEGVTFAAAGWAQVLLALGVLVRPWRRLLRLTIGVSVAFVAAWALSRTSGLPYGAHPGVSEPVSGVDLTAVGFEVATAALAALAWARPRLGERWGESTLILASVVPVALLIGTTAVVLSPSATNHGHGADGHTHDVATGDDKGLSTLTNGHVHAHAADVALDPGTQAELNAQLARTAGLVVRYPNVAAGRGRRLPPGRPVHPRARARTTCPRRSP